MRKAAKLDDDGYFVTSWGARSHFTKEETRCRCGCGLHLIDQGLLDGIERLRYRIAMPLLPISGVRCATHNAKVSKSDKSQHLADENGVGNAVDLFSADYTGIYLYLKSKHVEQIRGSGPQESTVHVDGRVKEARWMYGSFKGKDPDVWLAYLASKEFNRVQKLDSE